MGKLSKWILEEADLPKEFLENIKDDKDDEDEVPEVLEDGSEDEDHDEESDDDEKDDEEESKEESEEDKDDSDNDDDDSTEEDESDDEDNKEEDEDKEETLNESVDRVRTKLALAQIRFYTNELNEGKKWDATKKVAGKAKTLGLIGTTVIAGSLGVNKIGASAANTNTAEDLRTQSSYVDDQVEGPGSQYAKFVAKSKLDTAADKAEEQSDEDKTTATASAGVSAAGLAGIAAMKAKKNKNGKASNGNKSKRSRNFKEELEVIKNKVGA